MPWYRELAKATKRPLVWQSVAHRWNAPDMWRQQLSDAEQAFREGAAAYPITNARPFSNRWTMKNSQRFTEMPTWNAMMWLPEKQRKEAMRDPATRKKLTFEATQDTTLINFSRRWDLVYIREVVLDRNRPWVDKSVAEYAAAQGKPVIDAFLDLALEEDLDTLFENSDLQGDPDAVGEILRSPYVLIGQSDAGAHVQYDAGFGYCTRLLGYYVRDRQALALENAIRKLTFMPASVFGIRDRGLLRPGMNADVTVFDPTTVAAQERELVHDMPGGEPRYVQHARGVNSTIVNGEVLMEGGGHTGAYPGRVLRSA
jgi:N-acyl-D-amino-acid deacylase